MQGRVSATDTLLVGIPVSLSSLLAGRFVDDGLVVPAMALALSFLIVGILVVLHPDVIDIPTPDKWSVPNE